MFLRVTRAIDHNEMGSVGETKYNQNKTQKGPNSWSPIFQSDSEKDSCC